MLFRSVSGWSGASALCAALYQLHAERNLEIADVVGYRRLAHVELLCGPREASSLDDCDQHLELGQTHHFAEKCYRPPVLHTGLANWVTLLGLAGQVRDDCMLRNRSPATRLFADEPTTPVKPRVHNFATTRGLRKILGDCRGPKSAMNR